VYLSAFSLVIRMLLTRKQRTTTNVNAEPDKAEDETTKGGEQA
jgi:hypothetical protein